MVTQSPSTMHILPSGHLGHIGRVAPPLPPQSMSVSFPFLMKSEQVGPVQVPWKQFTLWQSLLRWHLKPSAHRGHKDPPQSTSVSSWFRTMSEQPAGAQWPILHEPL